MQFAEINFLDFLAYGALGVSLALAILSYRLLSREQEKPEVRLPMLRSIRSYLIFAIVLSLFFGTVELIEFRFSDHKAQTALEQLWQDHLQEYPDSTLAQKIQRIAGNLNNDDSQQASQNQVAQLQAELQQCQSKLAEVDQGFYISITKLRKQIDKDPDGWLNITFNSNDKEEVFRLLECIFISLGEVKSPDQSKETLINKWREIKNRWNQQDREYIFRSDIPELVRIYLDRYYPRH